MLMAPFNVGTFNSHYQGEFSEWEMEWQCVCAKAKVNNIQTLLGGREVRTVLDVGCGTGAVLAEIQRREIGTKHIGIDAEDSSSHAVSQAYNLTLLEYDGKILPFRDNSFDLVYASHVLEHVLNPRAFLQEVSRVASDVIYIEVPCEMHIRRTRGSTQRSLQIGHINFYTVETFMLLLQTSGLQVIAFDVFDHELQIYRFLSKSLIRAVATMAVRRVPFTISPLLASRLFTYHCGALCKQSDGSFI
jgi:SAM-dependent methyltransferase